MNAVDVRGRCPSLKPTDYQDTCKCPRSESWCRKMVNFSGNEFLWVGRDGSAEASDLGFRPGPLPQNIWVKGKVATLRFEKQRQEIRDGDVLYTEFLAVGEGRFHRIRIFND